MPLQKFIMDKRLEYRRRRRFAVQNDGARRRGSTESAVFAFAKMAPKSCIF